MLRYDTFITLEVFLCIEYKKALEFIFRFNRKARNFLQQHISIIKNGFVNEGLITHHISLNFEGYRLLEQLYK
jgi:hypothetical protein